MTILAIDVGSSSVRAIMFQNNGDNLTLIPDAIVQKHYHFDTDASGRATVDATFLRHLVEQCVDNILTHQQAKSIQAVGIDTFAGNLLPVDSDNTPLAPLVTYADTRSSQHIPNVQKQLADYDVLQATGARLHAAYYPAQMQLFEYPHDAEPFIASFIDFATYCYRAWSGDNTIPMSYSLASWSGLLNRQSLTWDATILDAINTPSLLMPSLADYSQAQTITRWKALADVPFFLSVGDGASAQVGSGAIAADTAALTVGTTSALRTVRTGTLPPVPDGGWSYRIDADHHLLGGALSEGGNLFDWARRTFKLDMNTIESELSKREPAQHGLTVIPTLAGERSPFWRSDAVGTIHGLRLTTEPIDILHALLESVAVRLAIIAQQVNLPDETQIMASGGALHGSSAWANIIADALGCSLQLLDEPEITALGTAQLANCALHDEPITGASSKTGRTIEPRQPHHEQCTELVQEQMNLHHTLYRDESGE